MIFFRTKLTDCVIVQFIFSAGESHRRTSRTSAASLNRGRIQGPLTDFEEDQVLHGLEDVYFQEETAEFDPTSHELSKFPPNFDQAAVDVQVSKYLGSIIERMKRIFQRDCKSNRSLRSNFTIMATILKLKLFKKFNICFILFIKVHSRDVSAEATGAT